MKKEDLKRLQTKKSDLSSLINHLESKKFEIQKEISESKQEINKINQKIKASSRKQIIVSEHAVLRYIERKLGIDTDTIIADILGNKTLQKMSEKANNFEIKSDSYSIVVKNRIVVTVK